MYDAFANYTAHLSGSSASYAAAFITAALAVLGIIFGKNGTFGGLNRIGVAILILTLLSGVFALYEVYQRDLDKVYETQARANVRRINNLIIAGAGGLSRKVSRTDLWFTVIESDNSTEVQPASEEMSGPGDNGSRVSAELADKFNAVFFSKTDTGEMATISFGFRGRQYMFNVATVGADRLNVKQDVDGRRSEYVCAPSCPDTNAEIAKRNLLRVDYTGSERSLGMNLAEPMSVAELVSAIDGLRGSWLKIDLIFSKNDDYYNVLKLLPALQISFKFYTDALNKGSGACATAFIYNVPFVAHRISTERKVSIVSKGIDPIDLNVCETAP